jgi:hypothetical protein
MRYLIMTKQNDYLHNDTAHSSNQQLCIKITNQHISYLRVKQGTNWLMITDTEFRVAPVSNLCNSISLPQDAVTPGWCSVLLTVHIHKKHSLGTLANILSCDKHDYRWGLNWQPNLLATCNSRLQLTTTVHESTTSAINYGMH